MMMAIASAFASLWSIVMVMMGAAAVHMYRAWPYSTVHHHVNMGVGR